LLEKNRADDLLSQYRLFLADVQSSAPAIV
jgi:hypothetical protein